MENNKYLKIIILLTKSKKQQKEMGVDSSAVPIVPNNINI